MVEWLLQNSLGPLWLAMCRRHGWTPEVEADGTLARLEERRVEWRRLRELRQTELAALRERQARGEDLDADEARLPGVSLTELMPLRTEAERRWADFVPQPIPGDPTEGRAEGGPSMSVRPEPVEGPEARAERALSSSVRPEPVEERESAPPEPALTVPYVRAERALSSSVRPPVRPEPVEGPLLSLSKGRQSAPPEPALAVPEARAERALSSSVRPEPVEGRQSALEAVSGGVPFAPLAAARVAHKPAGDGGWGPDSVRDLRILDPAVGSGHFLVVAFGLLAALYREEARHRGEAGQARWSERAIVERILEHNLHGLDLDPRAVQIAAAALWLKARQACPEARPRRLNLVASDLRLAGLPDDDPALVELRREVERETGIPARLTDEVIHALQGADHLGSLLQVDAAVDEAIRRHEAQLKRPTFTQGGLFDAEAAAQQGGGASHATTEAGGRPDAAGSESIRRAASTMPAMTADAARATVLERLEGFLARHTGGEDLGLRLRGEQLAAGVRFVRMLREGTYNMVVGNPPYQGTSKMADAAYVKKHYPRGKADLYAAFLERGLQLASEGGMSALLTMRNWMFIKQYADLRTWLLQTYDLRALGDFDRGAFEDVPDEVVSVVVSVLRKAAPAQEQSVALQPTPTDDRTRDSERTARKRAAVRCQVGRHQFDPQALKAVPEWPLVYWWTGKEVRDFVQTPAVGAFGGCKEGLGSRDDTRFLRNPWEVAKASIPILQYPIVWLAFEDWAWVPFIKGAAGKRWLEPLDNVVRWRFGGGEIALFERSRFGRGADKYFHRGVAVATMGHAFSGRMHRFASVFGDAGVSVFSDRQELAVCVMNSGRGRAVLESLNPSTSFKVNDVNRLPLFHITGAHEIFAIVQRTFTEHERHREPSVEFIEPGPTTWRYAQDWAQAAVDRPEGAPLPPYEPVYDPEPATDHLSFSLGVALGRFRGSGERRAASGERGEAGHGPDSIARTAGELASDANGRERRERNATQEPRAASGEQRAEQGQAPGTHPAAPGSELAARSSRLAASSSILDPLKDDLSYALPGGILFLDGTLDATDLRDSLGHPAARPLLDAWEAHGPDVDPGGDLRDSLRTRFFDDVHRKMYENRPIHWPLSSEKKTFVAWVTIHRWTGATLRLLLADHLMPALARLDGELNDLRAARDSADKKASRAAEKRYAKVLKARDELTPFLAAVEQCAEKGAPPTDGRCPPREADARYEPDLDDGVMINSAALWPLLAPQWKDPAKWWKELCTARGRKDYDWAHLAMRYWPTRVDEKCRDDPSLGVAHGCFWRYHPARAWAWELRLQDEIGPEFRIEEAPYRGDGGDREHRAAWLAAHPAEALDAPAPQALEAIEKEVLRRRRKHKQPQPELRLLEPGLWTACPADCWELELRVSEKQGQEFRLLAPDEPAARAAYVTANPERAAARKQMMAQLRPAALVEEDSDEGAGVREDEEDIEEGEGSGAED